MKKPNSENISALLHDAFNNSDIPYCVTDLKIGDLMEWDSIGNFNLLLLAEEWFELKFSMEEMTNIKSIPELVVAIESRNKK
jgi:acyl carrier protein